MSEGAIQPLRRCLKNHWAPLHAFRTGVKTCNRCSLYSCRWRAENRDYHRESARRWYAENTERSRENVRRWREENHEHLHRWCAENRGRLRENSRRWSAENPEIRREGARRRRARKRNATIGDIPRDAEQQLFDFQGGRCAYCHEPLTDYHVDHLIPLARGGAHAWENLVLACPPCNQSKNDKLVEEWRAEGDES